MAKNVDFERALLALDRQKLEEFLHGTIQMYLEYVNVHGHTSSSAFIAATDEMIQGTEAMIDLFDRGEL